MRKSTNRKAENSKGVFAGDRAGAGDRWRHRLGASTEATAGGGASAGVGARSAGRGAARRPRGAQRGACGRVARCRPRQTTKKAATRRWPTHRCCARAVGRRARAAGGGARAAATRNGGPWTARRAVLPALRLPPASSLRRAVSVHFQMRADGSRPRARVSMRQAADAAKEQPKEEQPVDPVVAAMTGESVRPRMPEPRPVAVDSAGALRAGARAARWTVRACACERGLPLGPGARVRTHSRSACWHASADREASVLSPRRTDSRAHVPPASCSRTRGQSSRVRCRPSKRLSAPRRAGTCRVSSGR